MLTHVRRFVAIVVAVPIVVAGVTACTPLSLPFNRLPMRRSTPLTSTGAELAALGDCSVCRTERNGRPFAGGRGGQTPFGTVYATNITPDPTTGIGRWPLAAFNRATRDQIEGAMVQSASWTLYEEVRFDRRHITSTDWSSYPILRFPAVPESIEVHVLPRPGQPFLGTGEAGQGPMAAAIANALRASTGV